ncbi:MAG: UDP-N-acetylmuramate dehydrogenase [Methyloprofundus sp.]|nr:UDP-N-acetylmuramate dehydrogenase [Methyloprofundus sp.]
MTSEIVALRGQLLENELLAKYTSWRVGGKAERMYIPADKVDLQQFIAQLEGDEPVFWLGLGSNLLIRDGGLRGTVVNIRNKLKKMTLQGEQLYVESGVPCAHVARFCAEYALVGAEFLAGIPGTMGGALAMNAGAFGGETWDLVDSVELLSVGGKTEHCQAQKFSVGYRSVEGLQGRCFLSATLTLRQDKSQAGQQKIKKLLAQRSATQPVNLPSCGSVFRNPENDYAARLIEASGLKGYMIGGAVVSKKHANFIVNMGDAKAADIEQLIDYVQSEVAKQQGVDLQAEVRIIGEALA